MNLECKSTHLLVFSFIFRFSKYGSSPEELHYVLQPLGWDAEQGVKKGCDVSLLLWAEGLSGMSYGAKRHFTLGSKNPYPSWVFFFQDRCYFLLEMLCMQIKVIQQEKSPESNRTDKLSPLGNSCLSFIFCFFSSVQDTSLPVLSYSL